MPISRAERMAARLVAPVHLLAGAPPAAYAKDSGGCGRRPQPGPRRRRSCGITNRHNLHTSTTAGNDRSLGRQRLPGNDDAAVLLADDVLHRLGGVPEHLEHGRRRQLRRPLDLELAGLGREDQHDGHWWRWWPDCDRLL